MCTPKNSAVLLVFTNTSVPLEDLMVLAMYLIADALSGLRFSIWRSFSSLVISGILTLMLRFFSMPQSTISQSLFVPTRNLDTFFGSPTVADSPIL